MAQTKKPKKRHYFTVSPVAKGWAAPFPEDMLRYDSASFASEADAETAAAYQVARDQHIKYTTEVFINLVSDHAPTVGRWESFSWRIVSTEKR